jgi:hypothetical protein
VWVFFQPTYSSGNIPPGAEKHHHVMELRLSRVIHHEAYFMKKKRLKNKPDSIKKVIPLRFTYQ